MHGRIFPIEIVPAQRKVSHSGMGERKLLENVCFALKHLKAIIYHPVAAALNII